MSTVVQQRVPVPKGRYPFLPDGSEKINGEWVFPMKWREVDAMLWVTNITENPKLRFESFKRWVELQWPEPAFIWDEWADLFFGAMCGYKEIVEQASGKTFDPGDTEWWKSVTATGCASSGKSSKASMWVLSRWLGARQHTSVVLTSTSLDQLKRRIWAELCDWIGKAKFKMPLEIVPSDTEIRWSKSDKRSAIFGIAVKSGGNPQEAIDRIKGIHNRCVYVVVDEMTAVPTAITTACRNLNKGTTKYQFIGLGNAISRDDQHGRYCKPAGDWDSVTVEDQFWLTELGGCCLHFDGHRSPALRDPERFHFYVNAKQLKEDEKYYGGQNDPQYWSNDRGFWPPTGLSNTVMDDAMLAQFKTSDKAVWKVSYTLGAGFDPAFEGGDRRVLYPFKWGEFANGVTGIEYLDPVIVSVDVSEDVRWIHYQIADSVQRECEKIGVAPQNFIMDTTGEGGGLFAIMSARWSPEIQSVEFGGVPDKTPIDASRPITWYEKYKNRVTMLWYVMRKFIEGGQVRGLTDEETRQELCARTHKLQAGKTAVTPKKDMKLSHARSPDKADAAIIGSEFLRRKGIQPAQNGNHEKSFTASWNRIADRFDMEDEKAYTDAGAAYV